jgi:hypothetical protein
MVYYGECKLTKLHVDDNKKPLSTNEIKDNPDATRTVVNLSKYIVILGRGGIAGLEFINKDQIYRYNLICSKEYTVLVRINLKTLKDYFKSDLDKNLKPLYLDQVKIVHDFLDKYREFQKCMKVTYKSNQNYYLRKSEEEKNKARELFAERSLRDLRRKYQPDRLSFFSQTKNDFSKMSILINNVNEMKTEETNDISNTEEIKRKCSRFSQLPLLKPFIRNFRKSSSILITDPIAEDKMNEKSKEKNLYITLTKFQKQIPQEETSNLRTKEYTSSMISNELERFYPGNKGQSIRIVGNVDPINLFKRNSRNFLRLKKPHIRYDSGRFDLPLVSVYQSKVSKDI